MTRTVALPRVDRAGYDTVAIEPLRWRELLHSRFVWAAAVVFLATSVWALVR